MRILCVSAVRQHRINQASEDRTEKLIDISLLFRGHSFVLDFISL